MSCNSFKREIGEPLLRTKVLPSPRDAIEPLSPISSHPLAPAAFVFSHGTTRKSTERAQDGYQTTHFHTGDDTESEGESRGQLVAESPLVGHHGSHLVQGSPIDALATIALATSPTFAAHSHRTSSSHAQGLSMTQWSPRAYTAKRPADDGALFRQRPSKRARSEVIPPSELYHSGLRPSTSHVPTANRFHNAHQEMGLTGGFHGSNPYEPHVSDPNKQVSDAELLLSFARGHNLASANMVFSNGHAQTDQLTISWHQRLPPAANGVSTDGTAVSSTELMYPRNMSDRTTPPDNIKSAQALEDDGIKYDELRSLEAVSTTLQTRTPPEESENLSSSGDIENVQMKGGRVQAITEVRKRKGRRTKTSSRGATSKASGAGNRRTSAARAADEHTVNQLHSPQSLTDDGNVFSRPIIGMKPEDDRRPASAGAVPRDSPDFAHARQRSDYDTKAEQSSELFETHRILRCSSAPSAIAVAERNVSSGKRNTKPKSSSQRKTVCAGCDLTPNSSSREHESWISCNGCKGWFHFACAGFKNEREVRSVDKFFCRGCKPKHGPTTFVRKSSRAHAAVDYAGLNEGVLRTSDENPEHHYIEPIKNGTLTFLPDNFARMPPELVTAEYFQACGGITEPVVVPASMNPRPKVPGTELPISSAMELVFDNPGEAPEVGYSEQQYEHEYAPDDGQDGLDMVIPHGLTVRRVSELYGPEEKVEVIEVKSQEGSDKRWNMRKWADYYEAEGDKVVRNVISLEVSSSMLGRLIRRPKIVRDLDLQDSVWPEEEIAKGNYPKVQFYCLMSVADCYTDFHIDFGGSSVYYHIVKGRKTFFFIPPKKQHLKKYEQWCLSPAQNFTFLPDQAKECYRVDLSEGDTMLIPSGWIHAVWTPENSLVIGGNFLTRMHYGMQIRIAEIEKNTKVARKFRYPHFQKILWYAVLQYLEQDPLPPTVAQKFAQGENFHRAQPLYLDINKFGHNSDPGLENYNARYYPRGELDGLPDLVRYIFRTLMISLGKVEGISADVRNAVTRSIPKGRKDPVEVVKTFAMWTAWKRGNEIIPSWAHPDALLADDSYTNGERKLSVAALRKLERQATADGRRHAPDRQSARQRSKAAEALKAAAAVVQSPGNQIVSVPSANALSASKPSILGPKRMACDICRKRRIRCKHKEEFVVRSATILGDVSIDLTTNPSDQVSRNDQRTMHEVDTAVQPSKVVPAWPGNANFAVVVDNQHLVAPQTLESENTDTSLDVKIQPAQPFISHLSVDVASNAVDLNLDSPNSKRSRGKACLDCRRSKRRCIHDEFGNIDPVKAQEIPTPRGPTTKKRRASGESDNAPEVKMAKLEPADVSANPGEISEIADMSGLATHATPEEEPFTALISTELSNAQTSEEQEIVAMVEVPTVNRSYSGVDEQSFDNVPSNSVIEPQEADHTALPTSSPVTDGPELNDNLLPPVSAPLEETAKTERFPIGSSHMESSCPLSVDTAAAKASPDDINTALPHLEEKTNAYIESQVADFQELSSPLTDVSLSDSPRQPQQQATQKPDPPTPVRHSSRQSKPVDRFSIGTYESKRTPTGKGTSPVVTPTKAAQASPASLSSARAKTTPRKSLSTTPVARSASKSGGKEAANMAKPPKLEYAEDESLRLARMLAGSEFGLRRRS